MKVSSGITYSFLLLLAIALLFFANLLFGSVRIPAPSVWNIMLGHSAEREAWQQIVLESRLPQAVTALFTGGALAVSGLMLQTFFRNPLADPGILGISSGASLGVAVVMLTIGSAFSGFSSFFLPHSLIIVLGAFLGSLLVLGIIIAFSSIVRNNILLLIIGIMVGYLSSSLITLMKFWSTSESVFVYTIWGMGDFSGVSSAQLPFYIIAVSAGLIFSLLLIKPLNALLLGENYAINLGIKVRAVRLMILFCTGLLTAVTTAFCGPISFLGLAVPHMARLILKTSNHKSLLPVTILSGSVMALLCNLISHLPGSAGIIPLNAITPLFGTPVILYVILKQRKSKGTY
ncbi:iron ABC transporter permease [Parabacteroides sp. Marseille-P3160]|uniref:iron ABC transporter permease n=1 Tax=Parabacteroides sp. Marseille-P3160 TaxID=1917887 RepID=UPI0009B9B17E|nr:iron ABC transporter permease [Parabacteroides sp. Marseille-P3160]